MVRPNKSLKIDHKIDNNRIDAANKCRNSNSQNQDCKFVRHWENKTKKTETDISRKNTHIKQMYLNTHTESLYKFAHTIRVKLKKMNQTGKHKHSCIMTTTHNIPIQATKYDYVVKHSSPKSTDKRKTVVYTECRILKDPTDPDGTKGRIKGRMVLKVSKKLLGQYHLILEAVIHSIIYGICPDMVPEPMFIRFDKASKNLILCTEYLEINTVNKWIHQRITPNLYSVKSMSKILCNALERIQDVAKFTHRDAHLGNVFYDQKKQICKFIDFDYSCVRTIRPDGTEIIISVPRAFYDTTRTEYGKNKSIDAAIFFTNLYKVAKKLKATKIIDLLTPVIDKYEEDSKVMIQNQKNVKEETPPSVMDRINMAKWLWSVSMDAKEKKFKLSTGYNRLYDEERMGHSYHYYMGYFQYDSMTPKKVEKTLEESYKSMTTKEVEETLKKSMTPKKVKKTLENSGNNGSSVDNDRGDNGRRRSYSRRENHGNNGRSVDNDRGDNGRRRRDSRRENRGNNGHSVDNDRGDNGRRRSDWHSVDNERDGDSGRHYRNGDANSRTGRRYRKSRDYNERRQRV
jgi:hypothetical protein